MSNYEDAAEQGVSTCAALAILKLLHLVLNHKPSTLLGGDKVKKRKRKAKLRC